MKWQCPTLPLLKHTLLFCVVWQIHWSLSSFSRPFSFFLFENRNAMRSNTNNLKRFLMRRKRRMINTRRRPRSRACCARRIFNNGGRSCSNVSDKLKALKNLIPANNVETVKAEQLFQQTADYIVLLRTQVVVLQELIELYGSSEKENAAVS